MAGVSTNLYAYDVLTQELATETQNGVTITRATAALGRSIGFELDNGYNVAYGYDSYGRFASVGSDLMPTANYSHLADSDLPAGYTLGDFTRTVSYEPARALVAAVENKHGSTVISRYDYANDQLGRRVSRADSGLAFAVQPTCGDPATVEMPAYNAYSYNTRSEVTGAARRWGTPDAPGALVPGQQYAYAFDSIGNRITAAEGDTARTASYTANALNQYTQRTVPDEKDMIGTAPTNVAVTVNQNPVSRQSAYWHHALEVDNATEAAYPDVAITAVYNPPGTNDPDVVTSTTGRVFVARTPEQFLYDDDGNLTQDGRFTYTWDGENRLIAVVTRDDIPAAVPRVMAEYAYDHQSRRIASSTAVWINGSWQAVESRAFLYDGWNVVQETINHQQTTTNSYLWGLDLSGSLQGAGGIGGLLAASLDGTTALYCHDANGNVGQLASTDGDLLAHYEYSPFGETIVSTGLLAKSNPFRFSTKWFDNDTGLGYWGYRWYSPGMGRWPSRDPIYERGGFNLYTFVKNDPIDKIDPRGLACDVVVKRITADVVGGHDKYGHEWIEVGGGASSYGWWPIDGVSIWDALFGVPGAVNRGRPQDPHDMDVADITWETGIATRSWLIFSRKLQAGSKAGTPCKCATCADIQDCLSTFAGNYAGKWAIWRSCRTFSAQALSACCLEKGKKTVTTRTYTVP